MDCKIRGSTARCAFTVVVAIIGVLIALLLPAVQGGPYLVKIVGYDGVAAVESGENLPEGKPLFAPYHTKVEFPRQDSQHDFDVKPEAP